MKTKLRALKLLERLEHHPAEKERKDRLIIQKISRLSIFKKAHTLAFYMPIHGEIDLVELFKKFHDRKKFALPRVQKNSLNLHLINDLKETEKGAFKILEPKRNLPHLKIEDLDIILIPGIVFSRNGHRIGYGRGFYDRFLPRTACTKIGIAYDFQIVENIEGEVHDIPMDLIITEKEIIRIKKTKGRKDKGVK